MNLSPLGMTAAVLLMLLALRGLFAVTLASYQSRKAAKVYRASVPFWRRWLMLDAPEYVRDKYSKLERKVVKARAAIRALRGMNLLLHALLLPVLLSILLHAFGVLDKVWAERATFAYFMACFACGIVEIIIQCCNHPNQERQRHGCKPRNW